MMPARGIPARTAGATRPQQPDRRRRRKNAMPIPVHLTEFWRSCVASVGDVAEDRFYEAFCFGDSEHLANELAALVLRGTKRATAGSAWAFEAQGKPMPQPGALSVVTNWTGEPLCVIETEVVEVVPFRAVSAQFAALEGEGDGSLAFWREAHRRYFTRECARLGRAFTEDMPVACEVFKVIYGPTVLPGSREHPGSPCSTSKSP